MKNRKLLLLIVLIGTLSFKLYSQPGNDPVLMTVGRRKYYEI